MGRHLLLLALLLPVRAVVAVAFWTTAPLAQVGRAVAVAAVKPHCHQLRVRQIRVAEEEEVVEL